MRAIFGEPGTLVGHRGLGAGVVDGLTQNTMESFLRGIELGLEWIEVDVRRARDDELFVIHNTVLPDRVPGVRAVGERARRSGRPAT